MHDNAYLTFDRETWARLRAATPLTLSEADLASLRGVNDKVSLDDVENVHLPLSRLLNLHVKAARSLTGVKDAFLGRPAAGGPYIIAIAGSVAVGKSTLARIIQALMSRWPEHPRVELVTTDGFLFPNAELEARGLMQRKGFPESYDLRRMVDFLSDVKAGEDRVEAPVYSHVTYDIVADETQVVERPDVLIFEGLNVLQTGSAAGRAPSAIVSDFFDFSLYLDAEEADIERWYVERFVLLQRTVFRQGESYFHHMRNLDPEEAPAAGRRIWRDINRPNLLQNILPTRERADVVLRKRADHSIGEVWLRQI
ncbi:MAG: type I pantothenate kinase [Phenylobacterium sp.]|uniref:type I pantothenate kinase n=1 Tax=Phenylobacterium sp. TaxID=1871053 RepID=UPI00391A8AD8